MEVTVEQVPAIQWFPGHMAKTRRLMKANLPYVDIVVELRDAKIPLSSGNPELASMIGNKKRVILLNKCDTADPAVTAQWIAWFKKKGIAAIAVDSRSGKGLNAFLPTVRAELSELLARRAEKNESGRPIRMMVVGIPNVGKSSFINRMAGEKRARVEDRPGVTRDKQWVTVSKDVELLDMPAYSGPNLMTRQSANVWRSPVQLKTRFSIWSCWRCACSAGFGTDILSCWHGTRSRRRWRRVWNRMNCWNWSAANAGCWYPAAR